MHDPILEGLVLATARDPELELPLVLISSGLLIEGTMVSAGVWLDELAVRLEAGTPRTAALGKVFRETKVWGEMATAVGDDPALTLHLTSTTVSSAGEVVAVGLWRLGMDAVDGWKLGGALPARLRAVEGS